MRKKIGRLIMIIGISIILIPIIGSIYTYYEGRGLYQDYLQNLEQIDVSFKPIEKPITQDTNEQLEDVEEKEISSEAEYVEAIGRIKIPSIKVDLLLVEGVSNQALKLGAGHIGETVLPGEVGNCAIAGHRNYTFGQMFNRLDKVKLEDEIILEIGEKSYSYKVNHIDIVKPEEVSVLKQSKNKKEVTLITCHPIYTGTHRLIVRGEMEEKP